MYLVFSTRILELQEHFGAVKNFIVLYFKTVALYYAVFQHDCSVTVYTIDSGTVITEEGR